MVIGIASPVLHRDYLFLSNFFDGSLLLADIEGNIKPDDAHFARTRLLALENTWGGQVLPLPYKIRRMLWLHKESGLFSH